MFYHIFFSLGMKQSAFISNKQGVYELPHKLLHELRFRILGNKKKIFSILAKNYWKIEIEPFP